MAVDGKTLKGARQQPGQIHLLTAFLHQQGLALAQPPVEAQSNDITAARPLLSPLEITGRVVTLDALTPRKTPPVIWWKTNRRIIS